MPEQLPWGAPCSDESSISGPTALNALLVGAGITTWRRKHSRLSSLMRSGGASEGLAGLAGACAMKSATANMPPAACWALPEVVAGRGYPIESHFVTTADGYILNLFRIPHGLHTDPVRARPVVLLQHALLESSFSYVSNSPWQSLGYILADAGYDVWFGNNRGNRYSTNHTHLSISSTKFWDFSWDEMARYDLPAEIDYVLARTGVARLAYVGHSQGTIQAFAGFSRNRTLAERVGVFVALAPIAYNRHIGGLWGRLGRHLGVMKLFWRLGLRSVLTSRSMVSSLAPSIYRLIPGVTSGVINWVCGPTVHLNISRGPVIVGHTPAGTSAKNMVHWEQAAHNQAFSMFDYGSASANLERYNMSTPPKYILGDMNVPTALFLGENDPLSTAADVGQLLDELHHDVVFKVETVPTYGHVDFTWAADAHENLYPQVLSAIQSRML
uniref:Partial AB-hydrolase lipase domain-containing protein n=1 Tax=Pyrodinium bahamense TaxID=73915 RepID=A0A7S0A2Z0_9DINO|mmetsp:Transcript_20207/g.55753  ORF Transcript_20207/g.55753 Transcript_20207/m.55753 type:complete len:442 (+) Transcript_20207:260-1585(+)